MSENQQRPLHREADHSLAAFAHRRSRLVGAAILEDGNPWFSPLDELQAEAARRGKTLVSFANYDYLGLANHPSINVAAHAGLDRLGVGALGSRLVGGERLIHSQFERSLAEFIGADAALTLVSGYLTNLSTIAHLMGRRDLIVYDELSHNSILSGISGSRATSVEFRHNDLDHLDVLLRDQRASHRNCLIVAEGLYSMDGDIPDLPGLLAAKDRHKSWLLVDEAHSIGGLGETGRGISEHSGEDPKRIDLLIGTLSKTFASCGGFICAQSSVLDFMRFTLPGFVYSVGMPPVIASAAYAALEIIKAEPQRAAALRSNAEHFLMRAQEAGLNTGPAIGRAIIPIMFPDIHSTLRCADLLLQNDVYAPPIVQVGVPKALPRIRFFISAAHKVEDIDRTISLIEQFFANEAGPSRPRQSLALDAANP